MTILQVKSREELTDVQRELLCEAGIAAEGAYNPYFGLKVGAAILTGKGEIIRGWHMSMAVGGSSTCAERAAIARLDEKQRMDVVAIAAYMKVLPEAPKDPDYPVNGLMPCGVCRQAIAELAFLADRDIEYIGGSSVTEKVVVSGIRELLPIPYLSPTLLSNIRNAKREK